jgi:hypothetical protein
VIRHALILGAASLSLFFRDGGCGDDDANPSGLNAPCTRGYDCISGLSCQGGVCVGPSDDAGVSGDGEAGAGIGDAAGDG